VLCIINAVGAILPETKWQLTYALSENKQWSPLVGGLIYTPLTKRVNRYGEVVS
jgi:hypothetical protein